MRRLGLVVCLGFVVVTGVAARSTVGDAAELARAALAGRQRIPAVRYELRWEQFPPDRLIPKGGAKPGEDGAYTGTALVVLDVPGGRARIDQDERVPIHGRAERLSRLRDSLRYDGWEQTVNWVTDYDAKAAPAELKVSTVFAGKWGKSARWPDLLAPLAWGHGLLPPATGNEVGPFPAAWRPAADRFTLSCTDVVGGRMCVVLRDQTTRGQPYMWIDAADGAVLRSCTRYGSSWTADTTIRYQATPHGRLPAGWEVALSDAESPPRVEVRVTVTAVRFDPPLADDFRVPLRPGMTVVREGRTWCVSADGELDPLPAADAPPPPVAPRSPIDLATRVLHGLYGIAILAAAAGLVGGLLYVRWRWLRFTW